MGGEIGFKGKIMNSALVFIEMLCKEIGYVESLAHWRALG